MEHTVTQKEERTSLDFTNNTERWCQEEVLKLAQHFHCFNKNKAMYDRVKRFELQDLTGFNSIRKKIQSIKIYLALEKEDRDKITCCPYLLINDDKNLVFELQPISEDPPLFGDSPVPKIFKDFVWNNWYEVENHLIDDLFHCWGKKYENDRESVVRVEYFEFDDIAKDISASKNDITALTLYPGIDMNKFGKRDKISFTPVLGVKPRLIDNGVSRKDFLKSEGGETFAEYSSPCLPTC